MVVSTGPLILVFLSISLVLNPAKAAGTDDQRTTSSSAIVEYVPDERETSQYRPFFTGVAQDLHGTTRRGLAPFQLCQTCRCCSANNTTDCMSLPCCFGINCNLPNKPYGVCALSPKTCDCTSCT